MTQALTNQRQHTQQGCVERLGSSVPGAGGALGLNPASAAPAGSAPGSQVSRSELERLTRESYVLRVIMRER